MTHENKKLITSYVIVKRHKYDLQVPKLTTVNMKKDFNNLSLTTRLLSHDLSTL